MAKSTIGTKPNPCEQLQIAVDIVQAKSPRTDEEHLALRRKLSFFAAKNGPIAFPAPIGRGSYDDAPGKGIESFLLKEFANTIDAAIKGESLPQGRAQSTRIAKDETTGRFVEVFDYGNDTVIDAAIRGLRKAILGCGHMLRECTAPTKLRVGRKRKGMKPATQAKDDVCGNIFVAKRANQLYCSQACMNRTLTRRKRIQKLQKTKRRRASFAKAKRTKSVKG